MKLRFIVVDDAPFIRELVRSGLESMGHVCVGEASDGQEALELSAKTLPDLVVLDLVTPKKNGPQFAKELPSIWPEAKILVCSTLSREDLPPSQADFLFHAWLTKPFTKEELEKQLGFCFSDLQSEVQK